MTENDFVGADRHRELPIGVSPIRRPSIQTSAQGDALRLTDPCGSSITIAATLPGSTCTVRDSR